MLMGSQSPPIWYDGGMTPTTPATILAIDDHEDNLFLLESLLEGKGFRVLTALNGPDGLAIARAERPDLILLDLAMPGMDGFEVLERLRQDRLTSRIPVIVLTANYREAAMVERGLELGATEYLTKPIQMDELVVRLKSALRLAAVEQELERLRNDFAAMLVHDMRAPLDGIRLTLSVLRRQEQLETPRWRMMDDALGALEDVGRLMEDLLHANRLEDASFAAKVHPLALSALLERSLRTLRPLAEERGLALEVAPTEHLPMVMADPALLKRVVDNLLGNALKFTETGAIRVTAEREGDVVRVSVTDTGPGIPAEARARIFDRYFHLERRKRTHQGSFGLGLAFCAQATSAMGGAIGVESNEGQGSTFWFTLPVAPAKGAM
jgi:two-component system, sensor histidine kinase and response regulator